MSLAPITLTTDKSAAVIDNAHRKLRQDESGLSITVTVLNEDNTAYDLTGKSLVFCENKQNNKIIVDDGKGDNSGKFNRNSDNDTKGIFTYVLQEDAYAASGMAWFEINDGTTVDSTKNFYLDVERDGSVSLPNNDYIGTLKALETAMAGAQAKVTSDLADMEAQITQQITDTKTTSENEITQAIKTLTDQTTAALSNVDEYTQKLATLQSQWDSELQSIQTKASADTDSAVKAINDKYTNDFATLQSNFTSWQTSTTQNYQKQVDAILAQVQGDGTEVANLQKQVDDTTAKMQTLNQQFSNIDFTQFLKPSALDNYYTKAEVDGKLTTVGAVKTVDKIQPDSSGNVQTDHYTKAEVDSKTSGTIVTGYDIASKNPTTVTNSYTSEELVDQGVLGQFADAINNIDSTRTPIVAGSAGDDLFSFMTNQIRLYDGNGKACKNLPPAANTQYFTVQYVFEGPNFDGIAIYRTPSNEIWTAGCNGGSYANGSYSYSGGWVRVANANDITDLQNNVYTKADIPLAFKGTLTSTDDMNKVLESGIYITQGAAPQNFPPSDIDRGLWGTILVYNHDAGQILQLWFIQGNVFHRWITNSAPQTEWQRYADQSDITNLQNQIAALQTQIANKMDAQVISQADYNNLANKNTDTLYFVTA